MTRVMKGEPCSERVKTAFDRDVIRRFSRNRGVPRRLRAIAVHVGTMWPSSALLAEVQRRRRRRAMLDLIADWEDDQGPIDQAHLDWADTVLDRQGVDR